MQADLGSQLKPSSARIFFDFNFIVKFKLERDIASDIQGLHDITQLLVNELNCLK